LSGNIVTYTDGWVKRSSHQPKDDGYRERRELEDRGIIAF
jgi:hypothetical protein